MMRVFYASHDSGTGQVDSFTWRNNLFLPLSELAQGDIVRLVFDLLPLALHQDTTIEANARVMDDLRPKLEIALIKQIEMEHDKKPIDLFFSYFASSYCSTATIDRIKAMGIITINWFCNASYQFYLVEKIAPSFDYCLVPEKDRMQDYIRVGANPIYCQEGANPNVYYDMNLEKTMDVSFVGSRYGERFLYLSSLIYSGVKAKVYGKGWKGGEAKSLIHKAYHHIRGRGPLPFGAIGGTISDKEMVKVFNTSKINLGFSTCGETHKAEERIKQVRLRDFEVPMSGGFYLVEENEELYNYFQPELEIQTFASKKELVEKSRYYLAHEDERIVIAKQGHERALRDHSWQSRLYHVLSGIGLHLPTPILSTRNTDE